MKPAGNDLCSCGSGKKFKHCCEGKVAPRILMPSPTEIAALIALYNEHRYAELENQTRALLGQHPDFSFGWKLLGGSLQMQGKDALPAFQRTAELLPNDAEAHYNLGVVLKSAGKLDAAANSYSRALELKPDYAEACSNLGNILKDLGQLDALADSHCLALQTESNSAVAHLSVALNLQNLGQFVSAISIYRRALKINPGFAVAQLNIGVSMQKLGLLEGAIANYRRTLEIKPDFSEAHYNLGNALQNLGQFENAVESYRSALLTKPDFAEAHYNLGHILLKLGNFADARDCYWKAQVLGFEGAQVHHALMIPAIMGTWQEILKHRTEFERNLDQLIAEHVKFKNPFRNSAETIFYLAYHGLNDRNLYIKIAKFYEQACPSLLYTAPHCGNPRSDTQGKIRVGFISKFLYTHSVSLCFSGIINKLSLNSQFEAVLISNHSIDEKIYSEFVGKRVNLPYNIDQARKMIAALELDILVYLDIGMEPFSYYLAFSRLARVQCVLPGHPVTTGISNMDYFLSTDSIEPLGADEHYSEKLIRFPGMIAYFTRPTLPATLKTRTELGLPENRHIYMCPMGLQKLHPDFDAALIRILQLDVQGVVVLFEDRQLPSWKTALVQRLERTIPSEVRERIVFTPWLQNPADFISAIAVADVILDPFHFGIGSTVAMVGVTGTPLVTKAGKFMRGQVGAFYCKLLDLAECITKDTEDYAHKAVQIASNPSLRDTIRAKTLKNNQALYENKQPVDDFADFFCSLADRLE